MTQFLLAVAHSHHMYKLYKPSSKKVKVKEVDLYNAFIVVPHTQGAQVRITQ